MDIVSDAYEGWLYDSTTVLAVVTHVYRGDLEPGHTMLINSGNMDSLCGVGEMLYDFKNKRIPNGEFVIATKDTEVAEVNLCGFFFSVNWWRFTDEVEPILENHDCTCPTKECRLRVGKQVYKGNCINKVAYCARDERGKCRWNPAESTSIDMCRYDFH